MKTREVGCVCMAVYVDMKKYIFCEFQVSEWAILLGMCVRERVRYV